LLPHHIALSDVATNWGIDVRTAARTVQATTTKERSKFDASVEKLLGNSFKYEDFSNDPELESLGTPMFEPYEDDEGRPVRTQEDDDEADPDTYDQYVGAEVAPYRGQNNERQGSQTEAPIRRNFSGQGSLQSNP
jgi:hypothetical protein